MGYYILYRHFDSNKQLLYIGITNNIHSRISGHRLISKWFLDIANITLEHFPSRSMLIKAEIEAIQKEHPKHNVINKTSQVDVEKIKRKELERQRQQRKDSELDLLNKVVTFKPMYTLADAARLLDIPDIRVKTLIQRNHISSVITRYNGEYPRYGITGWQMLEFIEHLQSSESTIKELYDK